MKPEQLNVDEIEKMPPEELQQLATKMAYDSLLRMPDPSSHSTTSSSSLFRTPERIDRQANPDQKIDAQPIDKGVKISGDPNSSFFFGGTLGAVGATGIGATLGASGIDTILRIPAGPLGAAIGATVGAATSIAAASLQHFFSHN